ncbi:MAG: hypothetical protein V1704_01585 [Candidatus Vogelbacteria bacterium]
MRSRSKTSKKMDLDGFFRALRVLMKEGRARWRPEVTTNGYIRIKGPRHYVAGYPLRYEGDPVVALCVASQLRTHKKHKTNLMTARQDGQKYLRLSRNLCLDLVVVSDTSPDYLRNRRDKMIRRGLLQALGLKEKKVA